MDPQQDPSWFHADPDYIFDDSDLIGNGADGELDLDGVDSRDAKRRRIARACDMCRKKKIKCDGKMPKCSHCENYKTECIFTQVEKKRAPPKGAKYIEGLENRLGRMESLLRMSGLLGDEDFGRTDLGTLEKRLAERQSLSVEPSPQSPRTPAHALPPKDAKPVAVEIASTSPVEATTSKAAPPPATPTEPSSQAKGIRDMDALADQMCSLITNKSGETRYIGSSSGFSIFSPKGIQWVNEKTGDTSFQQTISRNAAEDKHSWDHWKPEVFNDIFSRTVFKQLPGRQECFALLHDYFEHFNQMFPLFHEPTFMHLVDRHYSDEPFEGSGWWASLNVALAIAHRLRVMSNVVGREEDEHAWGYLKNAMAVMTELTMRNNDLLSVQALLGMALFLQGTPNPQPSFFLTAAAIRMSHSIGLHKRGSGFNLNEVENEQRKRVFWIAYMVDKDICLRSGRPPTQDDDDMNVELPSENPPDNVGNIPLVKEAPDGRKTMNLFRQMCIFSQIQSRVYKQLYSVKASRQSDGELLNTIGELDAELEAWKDSIPIDFRPDHEINAAHTPLILHLVVLHFAYYNCLTTIHRMSVHHGYWTSRLSNYAIQGLNTKSLNPRVYSSAALCVNAARTSIGLIRYIPQGDYACVWLVLYYPVSALVTLFANILQNPQEPRARSDVKLMSSVVSFLTMLERDVTEASNNVQRMLSVCAEFERIAQVVLDKSEREHRSRGKRKTAGGRPQTEKEREKAVRERGLAEVTLERDLADGKSFEQLQVETQAHYRRPVQTSSLRGSVGPGSEHGNGQNGSPASWTGSPTAVHNHLEPNGTTYRHQQQQQHSPSVPTNNWDANNFPIPATSPGFPPPGMQNGNMNTFPQQPPDLNTFVHDVPGQSFSPTTSQEMHDPMMNGMPNIGAAGNFQQPFVPQDLWQMPMTLEWDWAEGLGLGGYTPANTGLFDNVPPTYPNFGPGPQQ